MKNLPDSPQIHTVHYWDRDKRRSAPRSSWDLTMSPLGSRVSRKGCSHSQDTSPTGHNTQSCSVVWSCEQTGVSQQLAQCEGGMNTLVSNGFKISSQLHSVQTCRRKDKHFYWIIYVAIFNSLLYLLYYLLLLFTLFILYYVSTCPGYLLTNKKCPQVPGYSHN